MEKVFDFNEFGICMNPNVQSFVSGKYRAMIETAPIDGRWYYGCMLDTPTSGFGSRDLTLQPNQKHLQP